MAHSKEYTIKERVTNPSNLKQFRRFNESTPMPTSIKLLYVSLFLLAFTMIVLNSL